MRRQAARRAAKVPPVERITVYHGTSARRADLALTEGLRALDGISVFATDDLERAQRYGIRAVMADMAAAGVFDAAHAPDAAVLELRVDRRRLIGDPAHEGDFALRHGAPAESIVGRGDFPTREAIESVDHDGDSADVIRLFAQSSEVARTLEPARTWLHGGEAA